MSKAWRQQLESSAGVSPRDRSRASEPRRLALREEWTDTSHRGSPVVIIRLMFTDFYRFLPIFLTFLGGFNPQKLPSRRLQTLWEWKSRVLLEEYYIFNVAKKTKQLIKSKGHNMAIRMGNATWAVVTSMSQLRRNMTSAHFYKVCHSSSVFPCLLLFTTFSLLFTTFSLEITKIQKKITSKRGGGGRLTSE